MNLLQIIENMDLISKTNINIVLNIKENPEKFKLKGKKKKIENIIKENPIITKIKKKEISIDNKVKKEKIKNFIKEIDKKTKETSKKITSDYLSHFSSYVQSKTNSYKLEITQPSYTQYKGTNASQVFTPKLQTFYVSDTKEINELTGKLYNNVMISFNDLREIQRVAKMNSNASANNYIDPEIMERHKIWKLFMYNQMLSMLMYDNIGS